MEESDYFRVFWSLLSAELHRLVRCLYMDGNLPTRDGNQGPGPRAWPVKACCGTGLGLHLVSPQNCGPRGMGSKRDGSKAGRVENGTGRKRDGLNLRDFEDPNPKSPFLFSPKTLRERERERERRRFDVM